MRRAASQDKARNLRITLVRSTIGYPKPQKVTAWTLGLRRLGRSIVRRDTPQIRGMLRKISHLVKVEEIAESVPARKGRKAE